MGHILAVAVALFVMVAMLFGAYNSDREHFTELERKTQQEDRQMQEQVNAMNNMLFYKDETTGLCFASTGGYRTRTMAYVPCEALENPIPFWSK